MYNPYDNEKYPTRTSPRLKDYDYSSPNHYFVTICTKDKKCLFGKPGQLNSFGMIAERGLLAIPEHYSGVIIDKMVVMPNHIHAIMVLNNVTVPLDKLIGSFKSYVSKEIHKIQPDMEVWQKSFHDHIIRNECGYRNIWLYIDNNPMNWNKDCFYAE